MTLIPPDCLGIVHTRRVLTEPEVWALERQWWCLWRKCWERQLLHSMALSSPSLGPQLCPSLKSRSIWSMYLQLAGLTTWNSRGLSEDEQESLSSAQRAAATALASYDDASLYPCFATGPLLHQFVEFFLPPEPMGPKIHLPMFLEFVCKLTASWSKPPSNHITVPAYWQYMELGSMEYMDDTNEAGLANTPGMEPSLAAYLAPSHNHGVGGPTTLPYKQCRFSTLQLDSFNWNAGGVSVDSLTTCVHRVTWQWHESCMLAVCPWREPRLHQGSQIGRVLFHKVVSTDGDGELCAMTHQWGVSGPQSSLSCTWIT